MRKTFMSFLLCGVLLSSGNVAAQTHTVSALSIETVTPHDFAGGINMPIIITGSNLETVTSVKLGATELSNVQITDPSQITAQVPWSMQSGTYDLIVRDTLNLTATMTAAVTITAASTGWTSNGPYGGNITDPSIDPHNPDRIYVSAQRSGVFRTTDGAENWQIERVAPFPGKMYFVYPSGQITPVMYLVGGTGVNGLQRSLDNGTTWQQKMPAGYNTWTSTRAINTDIAVDDAAPDRIYLGLSSWNTVDPDMGLYISSNRGNFWTRPDATAGLHVSAVAVEPGNPNHVVIGTGDGKVLTSTNGGVTWGAAVLVDDPGPVDALSDIARLVISPQLYAGHRTIWAIAKEFEWIYFSIDDGATWNPVRMELGQPVRDVEYHDTVPGLMWAAVGGGYYSTDNGATWTPLNAGIGELHQFAIVSGSLSRTTTTIFVGTDGGVFKSTNGGNTWVEKDYGLGGALAGAIEVSPFNADEAYAAVYGKGLMRSMDGGSHWQKLTIPNHNYRPGMAADPFIVGKFYFTYGSHQQVPEVYVTTDHGITYTTRHIALPQVFVDDDRWASVNVIIANPNVSGTLLAGLGLDWKYGRWAEGLIYASTDGGVNWVEQTVPTTTKDVVSMAYAPQNPNIVYAGTESGLLVSVDGGATWEVPAHQPNIERIQAIVIDPRNTQSVYITGGTRDFSAGESGTYATHDGGATWVRLDGLEEQPVWALKFVAVDSQYWLYAATMGGLRFLRDVPVGGFDRFTNWEKSNGIAGVATADSFNAATDGSRVVFYIGTSSGTVPTAANAANLRTVAAVTQDLPGGVYRRQGAEGAPYQAKVPGWRLKNKAGFGNKNNLVGALEVFNGQLYAATTHWSNGCRIWRSSNGIDWTPVSEYGMDVAFGGSNPMISDLIVFNGYLYASLLWGVNEGQIWRSSDGSTWTKVSGDEWVGNGISIMTIYNNELYAVASGSETEVWRSATGNAGSWLTDTLGAFGNANNTTASGAAVLSGTLYLAVRNDVNGMSVVSKTGTSNWAQANVSGFGSSQNALSGGMAEFGGSLYVGVRNTTTGGQVWRFNGITWTQVVADGFGNVNNVKIDGLFSMQNQLYAVASNGATGLQVWRSANGTTWSPLNMNGLGKKENSTVLWSNSSTAFDNALYVGTWNGETGGEVWQYVGFRTYMPSIIR